MANFLLEIVTPDRMFFSGEVEMVVARGVEGDFAVLKGRAPLVTPLTIGKVKIKTEDGKERIAAVSNGYIEVASEKTTIIADSAEWPEEIDIERAKKAKERAEKRLKNRQDGLDVARAEMALKRAINRLEVADLITVEDRKIRD
ncbi:F0F1 ATP synthase subunit epsilon [Sporanaerobacter acetigenes]|uniref:F0F1 ATP synthase subunit epsilon n=1 Tax=Sporanaerobacter acetigenes TaxID=165813 RepID=UPI0033190A23